MADATKRTIWCCLCTEPTNHIIEYRGTEVKDNVTYAVFYSRCCRCNHLKRGTKDRNVVSVNSWNALMTKEIYA
jgi:hypothetical protein